MKLFLHIATQVRIVNDLNEWAGSLAEFSTLEPAYPGLPSGAVLRYQSEELAYYEDATGRHADTVDCLSYCEGAYLTQQQAEVTQSGGSFEFPVGLEMIWSFITPPQGWLIENGQTVLRSSSYGQMLVAAGCPFGVGDGSTTVNIPDRRLSFPFGAGTGYALYSAGGEVAHTLIVPELAPHKHNLAHVNNPNFPPGAGHTNPGGWTLLYNTSMDTTEVGGGQAHNNMPPYKTVNFIVYVGS